VSGDPRALAMECYDALALVMDAAGRIAAGEATFAQAQAVADQTLSAILAVGTDGGPPLSFVIADDARATFAEAATEAHDRSLALLRWALAAYYGIVAP
jgi:hypothetical protein